MDGNLVSCILTIITLITAFEAHIIFKIHDSGLYADDYFEIFNPIRNYKRWENMNWFGVILFTTLLNLICPILSIGFWFYKLCTVGRK